MNIKRDVEDWPVLKLDKERDSISFPEYQREKSLWTTERKALLIDSILRDFDIPKLYFNRLKDKSIEVIDGQQRLWSVWQFLDDEYPYKFDGKSELFSSLSATQKIKIRDYTFQVTVFDEADDDYLRDLFIRLQWGLLLNTGEKLHAATGKMKHFVWNFANQSFIKNLGIPERRYSRQTLCAQITLNVFTRGKLDSFARTRYEDLMHFFAEFEQMGTASEITIAMMPKVNEYLSLVMKLIFAFGICFQTPVLLGLLSRAGLASAKGLAKGRRYAIVVIFIVAAVITPPDIISQLALAIPMCILYEVGILIAKAIERQRAKDEAAFEAELRGEAPAGKKPS
jgi:hypothetical protein